MWVGGDLAEQISIGYIIQLIGHCIAMWYAIPWSLVKLTKIETSWGVARHEPNS